MADVLQLVVPAAVPDDPVDAVQITFATPTLSLAVPVTTIEVAEVEYVLLAGETMLSVGGVVSGEPGDGEGGAGDGPGSGGGEALCWRVTVTL